MERRESDWRTVVLAIGAGGGALLAFSAAVLVTAYAILGAFQPELADGKRSVLDVVVFASALAAIGVAFLPASYYSVQRLSGRAVYAATPRILRVWQGVVLVLIWIGAAVGAGTPAKEPDRQMGHTRPLCSGY